MAVLYVVEMFPGGHGEKDEVHKPAHTMSEAHEIWREFMLKNQRAGARAAIYADGGNRLVDAAEYDSDARSWKSGSGWNPYGLRHSLQAIPYARGKHR